MSERSQSGLPHVASPRLDFEARDPLWQFRGRRSGWVNASAVCRASGKHVGRCLAQKRIKEVVDLISVDTGIPASRLVRRLGGSVWIHPRLGHYVASWASVKYQVWITGLLARTGFGDQLLWQLFKQEQS